MNTCGYRLSPWEVETLRSLSSTYAHAAISSTKKNSIAPHGIESEEDRQERINKKMFG